MTSTEVVKCIRLGSNPFVRSQPIAEHGFSVLIQVKRGDREGVVMFDTGLTPRHFLYNLDALEIQTSAIEWSAL